VVVIDGLDEVPDDDERTAVRTFIRDHVAPDPAGNKVIVTSRIAGYQVASLEGIRVGQVTVERMRRGAIEYFIRGWLGAVGAGAERADSLLAQIDPKTRPELWSMSANPLLCGVLTAVFHQRGGTLPATRVELYQQATDKFLKVWTDRTRAAGRTPIGREEVTRLLERVTTVFHHERPTGMLSGTELKALLVRLRCDDLNLSGTLDPPPAVVDGVDALMDVLREPAATERALVAALGRPVPAAAALVCRLEWFTRPIGEALLAARRYDSAAWEWPAHSALREMATCPPPPKQPNVRREAADLAKLREALDNATDPAEREKLPDAPRLDQLLLRILSAPPASINAGQLCRGVAQTDFFDCGIATPPPQTAHKVVSRW